MGIPRITYLMLRMLATNRKSKAYVERFREKSLRKLLRYAVANSKFYREQYKGIDIETCALDDLPPITKPMMMDNFDDYVTDGRLKRAELRAWLADKNNLGKMYKGHFIPLQTSGTTGENALVVYDRKSMDHVHAAVMARHAMQNNPNIFDILWRMFSTLVAKRLRMASILMTGGPYPAYTAAMYAPKFHNFFVNHKQLSLLDPVDNLVRDLNEHQPAQIVSYPSVLEILAREQLAGRLKLKFDSPYATLATGSEPLSGTMRRLAKKAWNMEIQDTYGTSECFVMARSCGEFKQMHIMTDLCFFEVVDRNFNPVPDGQTGEKILVTNLFNYVQPFIRYEISDVTGISTEPCTCKMPFPTLLPVQGRTDDIYYIDRPGGGYEAVHPYLFLGPIVELDEVREYQLVQTGRNEVTFNYVPIDSSSDIENTVRNVLEAGMEMAHLTGKIELKLVQKERIPRDAKSGKYRQIISRVGAPEDLDDSEKMSH